MLRLPPGLEQFLERWIILHRLELDLAVKVRLERPAFRERLLQQGDYCLPVSETCRNERTKIGIPPEARPRLHVPQPLGVLLRRGSVLHLCSDTSEETQAVWLVGQVEAVLFRQPPDHNARLSPPARVV